MGGWSPLEVLVELGAWLRFFASHSTLRLSLQQTNEKPKANVVMKSKTNEKSKKAVVIQAAPREVSGAAGAGPDIHNRHSLSPDILHR